MTGPQRVDTRRAARSVVLAVWASFFTWLWVTGEVSRYLGPRTQWVVPVGAAGLGAAALASLGSLRTARAAARPTLREVGGLLLLLVPVIVVVAVPKPTLGALAASRKSTSQGTVALGSLAAPLPERGRVSFVDIYFAGESESYAAGAGITDGTEVTLVGFVTRAPDTPERDFDLTRFYISCCAADAIPYSVTIEPEGRLVPREDTWLEVSGSLRKHDDRYVLVADRVARRTEPRDPYLY
jgi:putative membrane protein